MVNQYTQSNKVISVFLLLLFFTSEYRFETFKAQSVLLFAPEMTTLH